MITFVAIKQIFVHIFDLISHRNLLSPSLQDTVQNQKLTSSLISMHFVKYRGHPIKIESYFLRIGNTAELKNKCTGDFCKMFAELL